MAANDSIRSLAKRIQDLEEEITALNGLVNPLVKQTAPTLVSRLGIGTRHGAQLLLNAEQNIG